MDRIDDGSEKPEGYQTEDGELEVREIDGVRVYVETELGQHQRWLRQAPDLYEKYQHVLFCRKVGIDWGLEGAERSVHVHDDRNGGSVSHYDGDTCVICRANPQPVPHGEEVCAEPRECCREDAVLEDKTFHRTDMKAAFFEGYSVGFNHGLSGGHDLGGGYRKSDPDDAWDGSDAEQKCRE